MRIHHPRSRLLTFAKPLTRALILLLTMSALAPGACSSSPDASIDGGSDAITDLAGDASKLTPDLPPIDLAIRPDFLIQPSPKLEDVTLHVNLGDSIAAGYGVARSFAELLYQNDDGKYPAFKGKDLAAQFPGLKMIGVAISGSTSDGVVKQLTKVPDNPSGHTLVTLSAGGNDLLFNASVIMNEGNVKAFAQHVTANIQTIVDHFADKTRYPGGATIVFLNLYDPTDATGTIPPDAPILGQCAQYRQLINLTGKVLLKNLAIYDKALADFAKDTPSLFLADMHNAFLGHGYHHNDPASPFYDSDDPSLWFAHDCIHPNQDGHRSIRRLIWRLLFEAP